MKSEKVQGRGLQRESRNPQTPSTLCFLTGSGSKLPFACGGFSSRKKRGQGKVHEKNLSRSFQQLPLRPQTRPWPAMGQPSVHLPTRPSLPWPLEGLPPPDCSPQTRPPHNVPQGEGVPFLFPWVISCSHGFINLYNLSVGQTAAVTTVPKQGSAELISVQKYAKMPCQELLGSSWPHNVLLFLTGLTDCEGAAVKALALRQESDRHVATF
ncbi:PREDICTED: uncharacterized protein LOC106149814 [Chinchilla lanigera]|uniref:uncharacterized protein LOC106149814 n=1 Tax=Chinchilla lanigera TaxID=34839 RepID=UPI0006978F0D|nr:PREDICTED: uncharacterized protein LOC106149814 [Chinchilla lanigera]XP_013375564.1 PREDICTED: uncharacterized protein LOC106149814 [Chinchilla lanigera]